MKSTKKIIGLTIATGIVAGIASFAFLAEYTHYGKLPPYLQRTNVRENAYQELKTLKRTEYSKPVEIDGKKYEVTVKRKEESFISRRGLELKVKNLKTNDRVRFFDIDDTIHYRKGNVGGVFYAEEPKFRSIDKLWVNLKKQWTNKQREEKMNEFLRPLEQDLKKLADAAIKRKEVDWKIATGTNPPDYIKILDVQYWPSEDRNTKLPFIAIGMEGYDKEGPKTVHFYVDGKYVAYWGAPQDFSSDGKLIKSKELESTKYGTACLPHEKDKSVTAESYKNLKKGTHILTAVLEDHEGNTTEDKLLFKVK